MKLSKIIIVEKKIVGTANCDQQIFVMALNTAAIVTFNEDTQARDEKIEEMKKKTHGG